MAIRMFRLVAVPLTGCVIAGCVWGCSSAPEETGRSGTGRKETRVDPSQAGNDAPSPPVGASPVAGGTSAMQPTALPEEALEAVPGEVEEGADCGMIEIMPNVKFTPGNLLVIFDRSSSMSNLFDAGANLQRLHSAQRAIDTALAPLVCEDLMANPDAVPCTDGLSVALLTFPTGSIGGDLFGGGGNCTVDNLASSEQIAWLGVTPFVGAFEAYWMSHTLNRGTPISVAFARANEALMDPDVVGNKAVLFLTDGEETGNCQGGVDPVTQASMWNDMGIRTHVVSLAGGDGGRGPGGAGNQVFNDAVATAGGTDVSINPQSSEQLTQEIAQIVSSSRGSVTCELTIQDAKLTNLNQACEQGEVFVQSTKVPCDQKDRSDGFYVKDQRTIEIVGSFCEQLEDTMSLRAMFPCEILGPG
ncbi:MAG: hypothetical protein OXR73_14030 [Myxococcales bacterium]|nr:hypothetical protein [Myxococcales bacterium]